MDIRILDDATAVAEEAAARIAAWVAARPDAVIAIPTGLTPVELYRRLVAAHRAGAPDLGGVSWFALDEFQGVAPDHPGSFRRWLLEALIHPAGLDPERLHSLRGDAPDPAAEARAYEARIRAAGGLDLAVLGVGRNGHLAFNEPGTPPDSPTGTRRLTEATREANAYLFSVGEVPTHGMSMGLGTLAATRRLLLLATGASKAAAVQAMTRPETSVTTCPAALLRDHPDAVALVDREAAAALHVVA
ncbi:MAG: glucosamine-6-phosphate deaminase [Pseudomonadota bacterium]